MEYGDVREELVMEETVGMLPLHPDFLLFLKFFVVVTCIFFWIRLGVRWMMRGYYHRHYPRRHE